MAKTPSSFAAAGPGTAMAMAPALAADGGTVLGLQPGPSPRARVPGNGRRTTKVIRDSFTMPVADHKLIGLLKERCIGLGIAIKKSELLRAGIAALDRLPDEHLIQVVAAVESIKTGRPPGKNKKKKKKKKKKRKTNRAKGKRK